MNNQYIRDEDISWESKSDNEIKKELIRRIKNVILDLEVAHQNYDDATGDLVDFYTYQIKAFEARYDYLIRMSKNLKIENFKKIM